MEKFTQTLLATRQSEYSRFASLLLTKQSLAVVSPDGSGKSYLLSQAFPEYLKQHYSPNFVFHTLSPLDPGFADRIFDLDLSSGPIYILFLDDLNRRTCTASLEPLWNYLWAMRTALKHRLVFLFGADEPLDPSVFSKLGFCYLENQFNLRLPSFKEMSVFIDCISLGSSLNLSLKRQIFTLSHGNFRLAKYLVKDLASGFTLDTLLTNPASSPRLSYFFIKLLQTGLTPQDLVFRYSGFSAYFSSQPAFGFDHLLTASEKKAFDLLLSQKGELVDRDDLIKYVWDDSKHLDLYDHSLDQLIYRLKQKLKPSPYRLYTRKGRGFILS